LLSLRADEDFRKGRFRMSIIHPTRALGFGKRLKGAASVLALGSALLAAACGGGKREPAAASPVRVTLGVEVLLEKHLDLLKGKNLGLITNPTGTDRHLRSTLDLYFKGSGLKWTALYGPEHGIRGNAQAGEYVPFYVDDKYRIPVFSLYGQSLKPAPGMLKNIDEYMRSFDTTGTGKTPEGEMVRGIDVLVFDMQDVGTRIYTYIATMAYAMQAAAENGIEFVVLDRPNPINGTVMEGPVLEYPRYSSFVGLYPIPVRHGMTIGELALLFNDRFLERKVELTVIPMEGWTRPTWFDETDLPWVLPSPNMPALDTAVVYPGQVYLEGTNLSEGRGTTKPFELFGAPWIDGNELAARLNGLGLPGVLFREAWFTPWFSKFQGEPCGGAQIHVTDRNLFRPFETTLHIIWTVRDMYPSEFDFHPDYFDKIMGTDRVRYALERGLSVQSIIGGLADELAAFAELREPFLLY
jgi:uncharacterized protein YbbC (DUF1343 family)